MKKIFSSIIIIAAALLSAACADVDFQFPDPQDIPQYMIKIPIVSATATATNGYSMKGVITPLDEDHTRYNIDFKFDANGIDLKRITIDLEYCERTIHKDKALDGPTEIDLDGKSYIMVVNDYVKDVQYEITASVIPCPEPVLSATCQCGDASSKAEIDNVEHTIKFYISNANIDIHHLDVNIHYNARAELGEGAFESRKDMDLSTPYEFHVSDAVNDLTYTLSASYLALPILIPYDQVSVFRVDGDALVTDDGGVNTNYMFDGVWVPAYGDESKIEHHRVYWRMTSAEDIAAHGDFLLFDVGETVTMAQSAMHPYSNYDAHDVLVYEIYAYKTSTTEAPTSFSPTDSDWIKIIDGDDSQCWTDAQAVFADVSLKGTDKDPVAQKQIHGTIEGVSVPPARYYAFKMVKNCYEAQPSFYSKKLGWNPTNRWHWGALTELEVWKFKKD